MFTNGLRQIVQVLEDPVWYDLVVDFFLNILNNYGTKLLIPIRICVNIKK